jgi:hypothetical protein
MARNLVKHKESFTATVSLWVVKPFGTNSEMIFKTRGGSRSMDDETIC